MPLRKNIPSSASVAFPNGNGRLSAPAALRNLAPIIDLVTTVAPKAGQALELASGTGQHVVKLASALPKLIWQPTDIDESRIASISAWKDENKLENLRPPILLDAAEKNWASKFPNQNLILLINLIHLLSEAETRVIINEISLALLPGGILIIYGPFMRNGELTSIGDKSFHASLRETDPALGYKNDAWMIEQFKRAKLALMKIEDMPANNIAFVVMRPF